MAPHGDILRRRDRCLALAVEGLKATGGDARDAVQIARDYEGYLTDPGEVRSPDVEELIAAALAVLAGEQGGGMRLQAALQQLGVEL